MYKQEIKQLENSIPTEVLDLLAHEGCFIAGGALTSIFTGSQINDIDIYFRDKDSLDRTMQHFCGVKEEILPVQATGEFPIPSSVVPVTLTKKSVVFSQGNPVYNRVTGCILPQASIQFITFQYFDKAEDIFDTFDFTINMCAYDCRSKKLHMHDNFLKHLARRSLVVNTNTAYPLISVLRVNKYKERGYDISTKEHMRLMFAIAAMDIQSWEEVKDHIGGMYGFDVEDLFDESYEFSLESAIDQLSTVERVFGSSAVSRTYCGDNIYLQWYMKEKMKNRPELFQGEWYMYTDRSIDDLKGDKNFCGGYVASREGGFVELIEETNPSQPWRQRERRLYKNVFKINIKNMNKVEWMELEKLDCNWDSTNMEIIEQMNLTSFETLGVIKEY